MGLAPFTTRVKTNMNGVLQMTQMINGIMMTGDNSANQIIVELYDGFDKLNIDSDTQIVGYFIRSDGYTVETPGEVTEDGEAKVVIPEVAYQVPGTLSIAIRMLNDPVTVTDEESGISYQTWKSKIVIAALTCFIQVTETDAIIDPTHHIPDVQELLAFIEKLDDLSTSLSTAEMQRVTDHNARMSMIDNMTVDAEPAQGTVPTATISEVNGHKHIKFGLVRGEKGNPMEMYYDSEHSELQLTLF